MRIIRGVTKPKLHTSAKPPEPQIAGTSCQTCVLLGTLARTGYRGICNSIERGEYRSEDLTEEQYRIGCGLHRTRQEAGLTTNPASIFRRPTGLSSCVNCTSYNYNIEYRQHQCANGSSYTHILTQEQADAGCSYKTILATPPPSIRLNYQVQAANSDLSQMQNRGTSCETCMHKTETSNADTGDMIEYCEVGEHYMFEVNQGRDCTNHNMIPELRQPPAQPQIRGTSCQTCRHINFIDRPNDQARQFPFCGEAHRNYEITDLRFNMGCQYHGAREP